MSQSSRPAASSREGTEVFAFFERYGLTGNAPWMAVVLFIRDLLPRLEVFSGKATANLQSLVLAALEKRDFSDQALGEVTRGLAALLGETACARLDELSAKLELERTFSASLLTAIQAFAPQLRDAAMRNEANLAGLDSGARQAALSGLDKQALAARLTQMIGEAIESNKLESDKLEKKVRALEHRARIDPLLTSLHNRRSFDAHIAGAARRATAAGSPLSLLMIDVDHFKAINDTYGHQAGDDVLRALAKIVHEKAYQTGAFAARYGGEELVVLMAEAGLAEAAEAAESLRRTVENYDFLVRADDATGTHIRFTVSIGVAELAAGRQTAEDLVGAADKAMYLAKKSGRNRVVRYKD